MPTLDAIGSSMGVDAGHQKLFALRLLNGHVAVARYGELLSQVDV